MEILKTVKDGTIEIYFTPHEEGYGVESLEYEADFTIYESGAVKVEKDGKVAFFPATSFNHLAWSD